MSQRYHKTPDQLAAEDLLAKIKAAKDSARRSRIGTEKHRKIYDAYQAYLKAHPEYENRGICRWRNEQWELEHPAVTRSLYIRQQFVSLDPDRNRPISRRTSDREIAEGMLRYMLNCEWHGEADLITLGIWQSLMEDVDIRKMDVELVTAWLGNALGKRERARYGRENIREVEI